MINYPQENRDLACYLVTKHSWKGRYKRVFSIGTLAITTYHPTSLEVTNQWLYEDFISIKPNRPNSLISNEDFSADEFIISMKKKLKNDTMRFSSEFSQIILTEALKFHSKFSREKGNYYRCNGFKLDWSDQRIPTIFRVSPSALERLDKKDNIIASYNYIDIKHIIRVSDCPNSFVLEIGDQRRRHIFVVENFDQLINEIKRNAYDNIGIRIDVSRNLLTLDQFKQTRLGMCSSDEKITSFVEFKVQKFSPRHETFIRRLLCLSESCIIERDPTTYFPICARPLKTIVCLIRDLKDPQIFKIEYNNGEVRTYASTERDLVLASLIDGTRSSGNMQIFVFAANRFDRSLKLLPHKYVLDEESETLLLKHIISPPIYFSRYDLFRRFNSNIPFNGLTHSQPSEGFFQSNKGKMIITTIESVLTESYQKDEENSILKGQAQLHCLHRLFASKAGFQAFSDISNIREKLGQLVISFLKWKDEIIDHCVVEMLTSLMYPMHPNYELRFEQLNKQSLLSSKTFVEHLLDLVVGHVERGTGYLVISSMLDFLTYAVCAPYSETTSGDSFDNLLTALSKRGRSFYKLFHNPSLTIIKGAGLVMQAIIEESSHEISEEMQNLSLTEGAFLKHLQLALLSTGRDLRVLTNRQLSGQLISLWITDNSTAMDLLKRLLPKGLLDGLSSTEKPPVNENEYLLTRNNLQMAMNESKTSAIKEHFDKVQVKVEATLDGILQHWNLQHHITILQEVKNRREEEKRREKPVVLRKRRQQIKSNVNWKYFSYMFNKDWSKADLIWNEKTRDEFRQAIENELRLMENEMEVASNDVPVSWNHTEFYVRYLSLQDEIKIGDYYLRILLNEDDETGTEINNPLFFFNNVYHRFLLSQKTDLRCYCLKAMAITYGRHHEKIGFFPDSKFIVEMLQNAKTLQERDHLVLLLSKLALNKENARDLIASNTLPMFIDLATLAHLHSSRAIINNQSNLIENSTVNENDDDGVPEWHYMNDKQEKEKPITAKQVKKMYEEGLINNKTEFWAEGMQKWTPLEDIAQFKWTLIYKDNVSLFNPTELCVIVLDTLIKMCEFFPARDNNGAVIRPLPNVKRILSEPILLYQIVQLLLTYDPAIVQRIASIILMVMEDNPFISRLYLSGVFFFILMYNGSNILPIARFLHYTHLKQAFRSSLVTSEIISRSILSPMLPEAAIYYLEEYGPQKYAEVFLGEFENPEIIWNKEMRRHMIEKIAFHISDFTIRLKSNIKALYHYCPITPIDYPQLKDELFCHVYYLRHLCDTKKFSSWPIRDPILFLRSCLAAWNEEINKKPSIMSLEEAIEILNLNVNETTFKEIAPIRKGYFKLAQKYHPDKNPEGREMFEKINYAYELLTSHITASLNSENRTGMSSEIHRIVLCLNAQSITYSRHSEELEPYKYAGYSQLIKTIDMESKDNSLFASGGGQLLSAAVELCYWTLKTSALNAEQLRRDGGLEVIHSTFDRCVPMITMSSNENEMCVQVCTHLCKCFETAAVFELCREKISNMSTIFGSIVRLLQFKHLPKLAISAAECCCSFAVCTLLQTQLFQAGVLWQLLPHLFKYDYTLDEGGVEHNEENNEQAKINKLARYSCEALASLAGFRENTPENDGIINSLRAMLTPFVCRLMALGDNDKVLKVLNTNTENPYIIWDNSTRAEVLDFVEKNRTSPVNESELFGAEFRMSLYANELIVGDIFIRIYNEQPNFVLMEPKNVLMDFIGYLDQQLEIIKPKKKLVVKKQNNDDLINFDDDDNDNMIINSNGFINDHEVKKSGISLTIDKKLEMVLESIINILTHNQGIEILLIGNLNIIFSFLNFYKYQKIQNLALKIIGIAAGSKECVTEIAQINQLPNLFVLLKELPNSVEILLQLLIALSSNGTVVKETLEYGGLLYILNILCDQSKNNVNRCLAAELLSKLQTDKLTGPRWTRFIIRYLPPIFTDSLRDSPTAAILMFDSNNENPELIWNDDVRNNVKKIVNNELDKFYLEQKKDLTTKWNTVINTNQPCPYENVLNGEILVGGIFIRLFISNPSWSVRHPKQFSTELMERVLELMNKPTDELEIMKKALCLLIVNHPTTTDNIPTQGYLPQFVNAMKSKEIESAKAALTILSSLVENNYCCDSLSNQNNLITGVLHCMKISSNECIPHAAHALKYLLKRNANLLAGQVLNSGIINHLLFILSDPLNNVENSSAAKAEIVDALKAVIIDIQYGEKINDILKSNPIWGQYKDQRHDLFLPTSRTQAIMGPAPSGQIAGYLTEGMFHPPPIQSVPPPRDENK
ncbi:DnaJ homolog subfamily C member 13 [Strongyloides ratti]|uniref:DnaJ homolog subfamily C member 13 n=1 Tax=Strongyloides ratti TaxID=34506 RepID=A0A090LHY2_STRRB|nr:DnaJ homolog subfamily C member 13 [Strongyloides ratti]CEF67733.1 DnaJ homolog subfamily C member 13 [Strongyloides ratti]